MKSNEISCAIMSTYFEITLFIINSDVKQLLFNVWNLDTEDGTNLKMLQCKNNVQTNGKIQNESET